MPLNSIINLVLLVALLPLVYSFLSTYFGMPSMRKDLFVARGSILLLIFGVIGIALSPTPTILIFGMS